MPSSLLAGRPRKVDAWGHKDLLYGYGCAGKRTLWVLSQWGC